MAVLSVAAGAALLALVVVDVFVTVFVPRGRPGPLTHRLYRSSWWLWRAAAGKARGPRGRHLLALAGPLLLPLTILVWALALIVAFTLVYLPLAASFTTPTSSHGSALTTALYFSAYSATTLGVGDVYATTTSLRLLSVLEAGMGFAIFTVAITYLLSVSGALRRSTSLALELTTYLHTARGGPLETLGVLLHDGQEDELGQWFGNIASQLVDVTQAQAQHPVLEYFHQPDDDRALPLALIDLLEVLTACLAMLDPTTHPSLTTGQRARFAARTASDHVTSRALKVSPTRQESRCLAGARQDQYERVRSHLQAAGVQLRPDHEARELFVSLRCSWDAAAIALVDHFAYPRPQCVLGAGTPASQRPRTRRAPPVNPGP